MRRALTLMVLTVSTLAGVTTAALAGGGGGHTGACATAYAEDADTIVMRDSCFEGVAQYVQPGATITVRNEGGAPHTLTAVSGAFDTGLLGPGESAEITVPEEAGTAAFLCELHGTVAGDGMAGVMIIGGGVGAVATDGGRGGAAAEPVAAVAPVGAPAPPAPVAAAPADRSGGAAWGAAGAAAGLALGAAAMWLFSRRRGHQARVGGVPELTPAA